MAKPITWQPKPLRQIQALEDYFLNEIGSVQALDNFLEKLDFISKYPTVGRPTGRKNIRYIKVDDHRSIFYRIFTNHLLIILLWDSRQHPDKNPFLKKKR